MDRVIENFKQKYQHLKKYGLVIHDNLLEIDGTLFIKIDYPFIFDSRWLPHTFEGYYLRGGLHESELPEEFQVDRSKWNWYEKAYVWAPERFEKFVDRCADKIREKLDNPSMTKSEMLDALCFGDFEKHKKMVEEKIHSGDLPPYKE